MTANFVNLTADNLETEHLCCAIADKKHQTGVTLKKNWLKQRLAEGHVFRKLDEKGKVFIEYAPLESAWIPIEGANFLYIYCLWVSGRFKNHGYGKQLLQYAIADAQKQNKSGLCVISSKKKKPFLSDKNFFKKFSFVVVDSINEDYELLALSFDGEIPHFRKNAKKMSIEDQQLTIYYGLQCPYIPNCLAEIKTYCQNNKIPLKTIAVDSLEKAKNVPAVFNNWAVFYQGQFETVHLLNEGYLKKMLAKKKK